MRNAHSRSDTKDGLSLASATLIFQPWQHRLIQRSLLKLQTVTEQPLHVVGRIFLQIRAGFLCVSVYFGDVPNLFVDMLLGTFFIDRFIHEIFPSKRKVIPWRFLPVADLFPYQQQKLAASQEAALIGESMLTDHSKNSAIPIQNVRQPF